MRIKLDENLPTVLRDWLVDQGHDALSVFDQGLTGLLDEELWVHVCHEGRLLITLDRDFADIRAYPLGTHRGILFLRLTRKGPKGVLAAVQRVCAEHPLEELGGCLVVADDWRTRVRRPPA